MIDPESLLDVTVMHAAFRDAIEQIQIAQGGKDKRKNAKCLALLGESGAGKSFLIDQLEIDNEPIETVDGTLRGMIRVTVPSKPTIKSLAEEILSKLDPDDTCKSYTEGQITRRIKVLLDECDTDVIVLEEFQHFYDRTKELMWQHAADWLKGLIEVKKRKNNTKRLLIVSGLETSMMVIEQNPQLQRRFRAPLFLPCFSWRNRSQRGEFAACYEAFIQVLQKHFRVPDVQKHSMYFRCYCATGGLIGHLKELLQEVVELVVTQKRNEITLRDFDVAFTRYLFSKPELKITYRPFSDSFNTKPTEEILNQAELIGTPPVPLRPRIRRRESTPTPNGASFVAKGLAYVAN